jgi:hypothetical protein
MSKRNGAAEAEGAPAAKKQRGAEDDTKDEKKKDEKPASTLKRALIARMHNTLHGFNAWTDIEGETIMGVIQWKGQGEEPHFRDSNKSLSAAFEFKETYRFLDWTGAYSFVNCPPSLRLRSGEVIDAVRRLGYDVQLQTSLRVVFRAWDVGMFPFSIQNAEKLAVADLTGVLERGAINCYDTYGDLLCDTRLWCTPEGKAMAHRLKKAMPTKNAECRETAGLPIILHDYGLGAPAPHDFPLPEAVRTKPAAAAAAAGAGADASVSRKRATRQKPTESSVKADHETIKAIMQKYKKFPDDDGVEVNLRDPVSKCAYAVSISKADECNGGTCHKCDLQGSDALEAAFKDKPPTEQQISAFQSDMQRAIMPYCPNAFDLKLAWDRKEKMFEIDFSLRFDTGANDARGADDDE